MRGWVPDQAPVTEPALPVVWTTVDGVPTWVTATTTARYGDPAGVGRCDDRRRRHGEWRLDAGAGGASRPEAAPARRREV